MKTATCFPSYSHRTIWIGLDVYKRQPPARIEKLAREIAGARPCFICQGWGPQRTTNGENISRAVGMLAVLTGNVGIKGGNTGARETAGYKLPMATFPTLENPVKTELSCFNWYQAIDDYKQMTATTAGIRGRERLIAPIKFIWNYAGNCLTHQHGGINQKMCIRDRPGMMRGVILALTKETPRPLNTFTRSPNSMPRAFASMGLIQSSCGATSCSHQQFP